RHDHGARQRQGLDRDPGADLAHGEPWSYGESRCRRPEHLGAWLSFDSREGRDALRANFGRREDLGDEPMMGEAPGVFVALEQSHFASAIGHSVWLYPSANVGPIIFLFLFAATLGVMDVRLLGGLAATDPARLLARARVFAIVA